MQQCRELLIQGLTELNLTLSDNQVEQLLAFIRLIAKWNKSYNLTAIRQLDDMVGLHLIDSLAILPFIQGQRIIDIGTGAGLPGIPLAIVLPDVEFVLLDSNSKKTRFVQQAILELKLKNVSVVHSRVEDYQPAIAFNTVTTRAFARLIDIVNSCQHLLTDNGLILAMKAQINDDELIEINSTPQVTALNVPLIQAERCVVCINK
ncbi:MAG: 16S rRNA (guanine(527)-N(7))-methyltransferase RsmG [Methylococcaceae bacterium]